MDPNNDVMLAYGINGEPLSPDHGFPIRSMIPAYVGGRNVKWLKKMWISKKPNVSVSAFPPIVICDTKADLGDLQHYHSKLVWLSPTGA